MIIKVMKIMIIKRVWDSTWSWMLWNFWSSSESDTRHDN